MKLKASKIGGQAMFEPNNSTPETSDAIYVEKKQSAFNEDVADASNEESTGCAQARWEKRLGKILKYIDKKSRRSF